MARAVLNGRVVAESDDVKVVEGYTYFPRSAVVWDALSKSQTTSRCFWKGKASYYNVIDSEGEVAVDNAFYYPNPWFWAKPFVSDRVAFWRDVVVS